MARETFEQRVMRLYYAGWQMSAIAKYLKTSESRVRAVVSGQY